MANDGGEDNGSEGYAEGIKVALERLTTVTKGDEEGGGGRKGTGKHDFWETQPVPREDEAAQGREEGPIEEVSGVDDVPSEPHPLPEKYEWDSVDLKDEDQLSELHELLTKNYVEDDENMFRFAYGANFLRWALEAPGTPHEWRVGVRVRGGGKLVAFISGTPATVSVDGKEVAVAEVNFLCVHKKLRSKRLAPLLIREVTRRVNRRGVWQAVYTAGVVIPRPLATCRYWHRLINPKKLVEVGFTRIGPRMTMSRTVKLNKLPSKPSLGLRRLTGDDIPAVCRLLGGYLSKFRLAPALDEASVRHMLLPRDGVIYSYCLENKRGEVTDFVSFYSLPSKVIRSELHDMLYAAYLYYYVPTSVAAQSLVSDALIFARDLGFDVFNALDAMENYTFLRDLKFGIGDGDLNYYLFNWRTRSDFSPHEVGLILV